MGMTLKQLARVRVDLLTFVAEAFSSMPMWKQRHWGEVYLRGLMLDGERKSVEPMSQRLPDADRQSLQQFLTDSPWDPVPVRAAMARTMTALIKPEAVVFDDTGFPKCGTESVGVARQYSGSMGKVGNCQIAVTTHLVTDTASYPANWRLFLPEKTWDPASPLCQDRAGVAARRARCKVPEQVGHVQKWRLALESFDEMADDWQVPTPPLALADAGYGDNFEFRQGLQDRGLSYVVGVKAGLVAQPRHACPVQVPYPGRGPRRSTLTYPEPAATLAELAAAGGRAAARPVAWRQGSKQRAGRMRTLRSRFVAIRVRPAGVAALAHHRGGEVPECWLLAEWPTAEPAPVQFWLSNLPSDVSLKTLVRWAKLRWRIEHDYREMKVGLGLDHFEGRTWRGFHHHVTLVAVAHAFITRGRLGKPQPAA
jgi:SRSO17 transposase